MAKKVIAALDLGSSKIVALIAERLDNGLFNVLGKGEAASEGILKGMVVNINKTAEAIRFAVNDASNKAGITITRVNVGLSGEHITSMRFRNYVTITNDEHEVSEDDLVRLKNDIKTINITADRSIVHIIPEEYLVDGTAGVSQPIGMSCTKLEASNHIILATTSSLANIRSAVERAGLEINEIILSPLASANAVLEDGEKDLGALVIDIGSGTTDVALFQNNALKYAKVYPYAGNTVTNDIRETISVVTEEAEVLKQKYGYAHPNAIIKKEDITVRGIGSGAGSLVGNDVLTQIIYYRMAELFAVIDYDLNQAGMKGKYKAGVVLTGGSALLKGSLDLVSEVFGLRGRVGLPTNSFVTSFRDIEKPDYATVLGLLEGVDPHKQIYEIIREPKSSKKSKDKVKKSPAARSLDNGENTFGKLTEKVTDFLKNIVERILENFHKL